MLGHTAGLGATSEHKTYKPKSFNGLKSTIMTILLLFVLFIRCPASDPDHQQELKELGDKQITDSKDSSAELAAAAKGKAKQQQQPRQQQRQQQQQRRQRRRQQHKQLQKIYCSRVDNVLYFVTTTKPP